LSHTGPVNPDVHAIADQAKHEFAVATQILAETQYRLGELAGLGLLDPDESMSLQVNLFRVWEHLYFGTLCAVRDEDTDDPNWYEGDNTYSDGRPVRIKIRIEPEEDSDFSWEHNRFTLGDGAVAEHPLGTICYICPIDPAGEIFRDAQRTATNFEELRRMLLEGATGPGDDGDSEPSDGDQTK